MIADWIIRGEEGSRGGCREARRGWRWITQGGEVGVGGERASHFHAFFRCLENRKERKCSCVGPVSEQPMAEMFWVVHLSELPSSARFQMHSLQNMFSIWQQHICLQSFSRIHTFTYLSLWLRLY